MITPSRPAKIVVVTGRTNCRLSAAFDQLVAHCGFLPESIESGTPYEPPQNQDDTVALIVDFVNADLYSEQLATLAQAVTSIASGDTPTVNSLGELLDQIRAGADNIDDAEDEAERRHLNQRAKTSIASAVAELEAITHLLDNIKQENSRIDSSDDQMVNENVNQEAQGTILANLELLAFTLRQEKWATAHRFRKPETPSIL